MFYFYCPKCGFQKEVDELPTGTTVNKRCGGGMYIFHYKCDKCGNQEAGFMKECSGHMDEKVYYRSVISLYQNYYRKDNG